jgi:xanthine dehydrogenase accessory factor
METVVLDARERFLTRERFPMAAVLHAGIPSELIAAMDLTPRTAVVLVAHDYKFEIPVLRIVLRSPVGYIGMLGGKRRGATIRAMLAAEGFNDAELARIHTPVGVDIGARSTSEIALSIAAELVAVERNG